MRHFIFPVAIIAFLLSCQPLPNGGNSTNQSAETLSFTAPKSADITSESASLSSYVVTSGNSKKIIAYFYYGEEASSLGKAGSQKSSEVVLDNPGGTFKVIVAGLKSSTKYYFVPAAIVGNDESLGQIAEFTTIAEGVKASDIEAVTEDVTAVSYNEATLKVTFKNNSTNNQSTVGVILGEQSTLEALVAGGQDFHASKTTSTGFVTNTFSGLIDGTTYYYVGYITVEDVTVYGDVESFTTPAKSIVNIYPATDIGIRTAKLSAEYYNRTGVETITFGICYSKTETTPSGIYNKGEKAEQQFTYDSRRLSLTCQRLDAQSKYYYVAYLIAGGETFYSDVLNFTTANVKDNVIEYTTTDGQKSGLHGSHGGYVSDEEVLDDVLLTSHTVSGGVCRAVFNNPVECMYATFYQEATVKTVKIPAATEVLYYSFYECSSLESVDIPASVIAIWKATFYKCTAMEEVTIPESVKYIGDYAFYGCESLKKIILHPTTPPSLGSFRFPLSGDFQLYVPNEALETYKTSDIWSSYADKMIGF